MPAVVPSKSEWVPNDEVLFMSFFFDWQNKHRKF
jgi:hypothetical protein